MAFPPTPEQQAAIDAATSASVRTLCLEAGAGTGKTTTLTGIAKAKPNQRGYYIAYNRAIKQEAEAKFPRPAVRCTTMHGLAYGWANKEWGSSLRERLNAPRIPAHQSAKMLGANQFVRLGEGRVVQPNQLTRLAMETVKFFCYSDAETPQRHHVPALNGADTPEERALLIDAVLPLARRAWADLSRPDGRLKFQHDHYLKMWALTSPHIEADYLMLDEAQDANPLIADVVAKQTHLQRIAVGDACQAIYGWRGATNYLADMDADARLFLSQSFRFGDAVAEEANKWLGLLNAKLRLRGAPANVVRTLVAPLEKPDAVLCRTNAEAVSRLMKYHERGVPAAIVGGGGDFRALAEAAQQLKERGSTWHPELCAFTSWGQVQDYVEQDAAGGDLKVAVKLIDEHSPGGIIAAIDRAVPEGPGVVTISTAHKSKGREWGKVKIADDFREPQPDEDGSRPLPAREEMMLAYVAVTRAQRMLDPAGLDWVNEYIGAGRARIRASETPAPLDGRAEFARARREGNPGTMTAREFAQAHG